jgi:DNA polymerase III delta subunit
MIYLFLGEGCLAKDQRINEIKKKHLPEGESVHFDFDQLDGARLDAAELKKSLISLPFISKERVIILRRSEKLSTQNKELILEFAKDKESRTVVLMDLCEGDTKNSFVQKLSVLVKVIAPPVTKKQNVFDMTKAMSTKNAAESLRILNELFEEGWHPLQVMGGLVWFWGKEKTRLSSLKFQKGLKLLQEADLNIKRSRLKPEQAMEVLVIKLVGVM